MKLGKEFSHIGSDGRARMVDVGDKVPTKRTAVAKGEVRMKPETLRLVREGSGRKGEVLNTALVAGVQAAKRTWELIPMCHNIPLDGVEINFGFGDGVLEITAEVRCTAVTGAEMEALTAVSVCALTVYDMVKSADKTMSVERVRLVMKSGGKSGEVHYE